MKRKPVCKKLWETLKKIFFSKILANCFTLQGNSLETVFCGVNLGSFLSGSLTKKIVQGSGNHSHSASYDVSFPSAHVALTRRDWCDVACFFFLPFFPFPFCWLIGAHSLRALESCAPKGIYDSQQGQLTFELMSTQSPAGPHWPVSLVCSIPATQRFKLIHQNLL